MSGTHNADQWAIENETPEEILRKVFHFNSMAESLQFDQEFREKCRNSARAMREGLFDIMVVRGLSEVRSGVYVAKLSTTLGGSLIVREERPETGL